MDNFTIWHLLGALFIGSMLGFLCAALMIVAREFYEETPEDVDEIWPTRLAKTCPHGVDMFTACVECDLDIASDERNDYAS